MHTLPQASIASIYIHIPYCKAKCDYCDFRSISQDDVPSAYISALITELNYRLINFRTKHIESIYIGGGTPSLISISDMERLCGALHSHMESEGIEWTIEVNPRDLTIDKLKCYKDCGITRLSLGIQALNHSALESLGRRGNRQECLRALSLALSLWGEKALSIDLIAGIPHESLRYFMADLKELVAYRPYHISLYSLTIAKKTPLARRLKSTPYDAELSAKLWLHGRDYLIANGYNWYEVSNFSISGYHSRHNLRYWRCLPYIGIGVAATGSIGLLRYTNTYNIADYLDYYLNLDTTDPNYQTRFGSFMLSPYHNAEWLSRSTREFEYLMLGLRTTQGVDAIAYQKRFNASLIERLIDLRPTHPLIQTEGINTHYIALDPRDLTILDTLLLRLL